MGGGGGVDRRWRSCLRHCIGSQKVSGPIPDETFNPQQICLGAKGGRCLGLTLPPSCADFSKFWEPQTCRSLRTCTGISSYCYHIQEKRFAVLGK